MKCIRVFYLLLTFIPLSINVFANLTLDEYLKSKGVPTEVNGAHIDTRTGCDQQVQYFNTLLEKYPNIKNICEIGFNFGHSSEVLLKARPDIKVISFDMMFNCFNYTGKEYIDWKYPGRHQLIQGNSVIKVPEFYKKNTGFSFDCIFIDGGHEYAVALQDIINMQHLARSDTVLIVDDIEFHQVGAAWEKCISGGLVEELERFPNPNSAWGWVVGRYLK